MAERHGFQQVLRSVRIWFDTSVRYDGSEGELPRTIDWVRALPFFGMHLVCIAVLWVGVSPIAVAVAASLYVLRMFAVTGFLHRYFSHRTFKTSRVGQFLLGVAGASAVQRGPIWWAAHHRHHHANSDRPSDPHSPIQFGFWYSHMGWILTRSNYPTRTEAVPDLMRFPELRWLDRFDNLVPLVLATSMFVPGATLNAVAPGLETSGAQMLVWGFFISTVTLFHGTCTINSLAHLFGIRRYPTKDQSRNNLLLALITLGEGWHNNHHHYPLTARQGFRWWEIDITYYGLWLLSKTGFIWDLRPVPAEVVAAGRHVLPKAA